jgi:DNA damage-binding protein 1
MSLGADLGLEARPHVQQLTLHPQTLRNCPSQVVRGVGGLDHAAWRAFRDERRSEAARNIIDGDLVETFLDLAPDQAAQVVGLMGPGHTVEEITRRVEELARLV